MTDTLDPEIVKIQNDWLDRYRLTTRWIIVAEAEGYSVHEHSLNGVAPPSNYATREAAAARVLQLLEIKTPVTPQNWPEHVCIGSVELDGEEPTR